MDSPELSEDLLRGAQAIGEVLYGPDDPHAARKVYNNQDRLPVFKLEGSTLLLALKSRLKAHLAAKSMEKEVRLAAPVAVPGETAQPKQSQRRRQARHRQAASPSAAA
jgi:hypothetical protein